MLLYVTNDIVSIKITYNNTYDKITEFNEKDPTEYWL